MYLDCFAVAANLMDLYIIQPLLFYELESNRFSFIYGFGTETSSNFWKTDSVLIDNSTRDWSDLTRIKLGKISKASIKERKKKGYLKPKLISNLIDNSKGTTVWSNLNAQISPIHVFKSSWTPMIYTLIQLLVVKPGASRILKFKWKIKNQIPYLNLIYLYIRSPKFWAWKVGTSSKLLNDQLMGLNFSKMYLSSILVIHTTEIASINHFEDGTSCVQAWSILSSQSLSITWQWSNLFL